MHRTVYGRELTDTCHCLEARFCMPYQHRRPAPLCDREGGPLGEQPSPQLHRPPGLAAKPHDPLTGSGSGSSVFSAGSGSAAADRGGGQVSGEQAA